MISPHLDMLPIAGLRKRYRDELARELGVAEGDRSSVMRSSTPNRSLNRSLPIPA